MERTESDSGLPTGAFRTGRNFLEEDVIAAVSNSTSIHEACRLLAASNGSVYNAMRRFEIPKPAAWAQRHRYAVGRLRKLNLSCIIESEPDRAYAGVMLGTEGAITVGFQAHRNFTELRLILGMTDRPWVAKFAEICCLGPPRRIPAKRAGYKDVWQKTVKGLRALMILRDVSPYLMGERLREAQAALDFFSSTGYRKGRVKPSDVWKPADFPFR